MKRIVAQVKDKLNAQGSFFKSVSILVGGTAFAQLLTVISLPIITRLYTPEQFSVYAIYASTLTILSVICCLRFEISIPIPKDENEAIGLSLLAIFSNIIFTIILCLVIGFFSDLILVWINKVEIAEYIWLLPIGVFLTGLYTTFQYWATRQKQYTLIAKSNMIQSGAGVITQILVALLGYGIFGLILGQIVKSSAGTLRLAKNFWQDCYIFIKQEKLENLYRIFKKNIQFPKYSVGDALANTASIQLPIMLIALLSVNNAEAGFLMLAMQLLSIPIVFIGRAVSQVYLAEAPNKIENGEIGEFTVSILQSLLYIGVNILIVIGILSPVLIEYIFGKKWSGMGVIISWMIPWFVFQLVSSPISMIMHIVGKQKQLLILTLFGFILKMTALISQYLINAKYLLQNFAVSNAIFYVVACIIFLRYAQVHFLLLIQILKKNIISYIFMAGCACIVLFLFRYLGL